MRNTVGTGACVGLGLAARQAHAQLTPCVLGVAPRPCAVSVIPDSRTAVVAHAGSIRPKDALQYEPNGMFVFYGLGVGGGAPAARSSTGR